MLRSGLNSLDPGLVHPTEGTECTVDLLGHDCRKLGPKYIGSEGTVSLKAYSSDFVRNRLSLPVAVEPQNESAARLGPSLQHHPEGFHIFPICRLNRGVKQRYWWALLPAVPRPKVLGR